MGVLQYEAVDVLIRNRAALIGLDPFCKIGDVQVKSEQVGFGSSLTYTSEMFRSWILVTSPIRLKGLIVHRWEESAAHRPTGYIEKDLVLGYDLLAEFRPPSTLLLNRRRVENQNVRQDE